MRNRTRILAARLAACSLSAAMVFTALPPTAVTSYASALEVDLDVEASKEIIGKVGVTGTVPYKASVGKGDVTARTTVVYSSSDESIVTSHRIVCWMRVRYLRQNLHSHLPIMR